MKRPDKADPKAIGNHVYRHEAKTRLFVNQWFTMMLRLAWVLGAAGAWSTYLLVKEQGVGISPALVLELSNFAVAVATTAWLQSGGHPIATRLCYVLVGLQLFGYASHVFNGKVPEDPTWMPPSLLGPIRDFVLPEDAFPLGAVYFFVCSTARRFMAKQLKTARDSVREFEGLPIEAVLATSKSGRAKASTPAKTAGEQKDQKEEKSKEQ